MEPLTPAGAAAVFGLLADETRCAIIAALARCDERLAELALHVEQAPDTVTRALDALQEVGLVTTRRSDASPDDLYFQLDLEQLQHRFFAAGTALHPALVPDLPAKQPAPSAPRPRVLFLCTHNSARSQMAEALLRTASNGEVEVFSAGSQPGQVHPLAIESMAAMHIDISAQRSKHYDEYLNDSFDYVITVCDRAREVCPVFPGENQVIHWSIPDPAAIEDPAEARRAFRQAATQLMTRIRYLHILIERRRSQQPVHA